MAPITLRKIDDFAFEDTVYMDEDLFLGIGIEFIGRGSFVGSKFSRLYLDSHWPFPTFTQWYKNGNPDSDLMLGLGGNDREWESGTVYVDGTRMTW